MWVYDEDVGLNCREISFVPGLYKIFDEILGKALRKKQKNLLLCDGRVFALTRETIIVEFSFNRRLSLLFWELRARIADTP